MLKPKAPQDFTPAYVLDRTLQLLQLAYEREFARTGNAALKPDIALCVKSRLHVDQGKKIKNRAILKAAFALARLAGRHPDLKEKEPEIWAEFAELEAKSKQAQAAQAGAD